jgi:hypothetical protein
MEELVHYVDIIQSNYLGFACKRMYSYHTLEEAALISIQNHVCHPLALKCIKV